MANLPKQMIMNLFTPMDNNDTNLDQSKTKSGGSQLFERNTTNAKGLCSKIRFMNKANGHRLVNDLVVSWCGKQSTL
jgi:hypothetical protein